MNPILKSTLKNHQYYFHKLVREFIDSPLSPKLLAKIVFEMPIEIGVSLYLHIVDSKNYKKFVENYDDYLNNPNQYYFQITDLNNFCLIVPHKAAYCGSITLSDAQNPNAFLIQQVFDLEGDIKEDLEIFDKIHQAFNHPKSATEILYELRKVNMSFYPEVLNELKLAKEKEYAIKEKDKLDSIVPTIESKTKEKIKI